MTINKYKFLIFFWIIVIASSCRISKRLQADESYYGKTNLDLVDTINAEHLSNLHDNLNLLKKTGSQFGLFNIKLGIHNIYQNTGEKGFKHWVKYKLGEEPVLYDDKIKNQTEAKIEYYLNGKGYFDHSVDCQSSEVKRVTDIDCTISPGKRYLLDSIFYPQDSIFDLIASSSIIKSSFWKKGDPYDRDKLEYGRSWLTQTANNEGFVDFREENIYYYVDTALGGEKVNLYLDIIPPKDSIGHIRYHLSQIEIYPNYTINSTQDSLLKKNAINENLTVHEFNHYINHDLLDRLITEKPNDWYSKSEETKTISRLLDLGLFRFVNIKNESSIVNGEGSIRQSILLTPELIQSVSGEVELNNRSGNFFGTGASVNYRHRNLFHHGENLKISLSGQVETQFGDQLDFINSADLNISGELTFPRFIVPFINLYESRRYIPRTVVSTTLAFQRRVQFYSLESITAKYGFRWKEDAKKTHELFPLVINQVLVSNKSEAFQDILDQDIRLERSFDDILIAGLQYNYTYTDQAGGKDRKFKYLHAELETSGNLLSVFGSGQGVNRRTIAGNPFAQFTKLSFDYRRYRSLGIADLVTRTFIGAGFAYGNSEELPYTKQFLIGGANSLRAFPLRGLGPGFFVPVVSATDAIASQFVDRTGDLKLEFNIEYRFPIISYLKGALFVDAGNIWLIDNEDQIEGNFKFNQFYKQIALGSGIGLRLDFDFFLIRLDTAFPLRAPDGNSSFEWVVKSVDPLSSTWRTDNLQYNIGIGYPF